MTLLPTARKYSFCRSAGKTNKIPPKQPNFKTDKQNLAERSNQNKTNHQANKQTNKALKAQPDLLAKLLPKVWPRPGAEDAAGSAPSRPGRGLGARAEPDKPRAQTPSIPFPSPKLPASWKSSNDLALVGWRLSQLEPRKPLIKPAI